MKTVSATFARAHLYDLIDKVSKTGKKIGITKKGEIKAILISEQEYSAWHEMALKFLSEA